MRVRGAERLASPRAGAGRLWLPSKGRFLLLLAVLFLGHVVIEPEISLGAIGPDFYVMALVFGALRWGPLAGAVLGFLLGINVDAMLLDNFGSHGLAFTVAGFSVGKMQESLYLEVPALDVMLLFAAALFTGLVVTALAFHRSFELFEDRFFYEVPLSALYTAVLGGLLFRIFRG